MPALMMIRCPHCKKQLKGPVELQGKKVRCKACAKIFVVEETAPLPVDRGEVTRRGSRDKNAGPAQMYQMTEAIRGAPRCPQCAAEMESEEAIICLNCGYNQMTGQRINVVKAYSTTAADILLWRLPGMISAALAVAMLAFVCYLWLGLKRYEDDKEVWWVFPSQVWGTVIAAFIGWGAGRFAVRRLITNTMPPEKLKF
jgi:DNA-directed RNA polymerase subunit RPC12/RpoP